jgi:hypothetical protein
MQISVFIYYKYAKGIHSCRRHIFGIRQRRIFSMRSMQISVFTYYMQNIIYNDITKFLAQEDSRGLNNGIIFAKPCAPFLLEWYRHYKTFNRYKWNDHSIKLPLKLYKENKRGLLVSLEFDVSWNANTAFFRPALGLRYFDYYIHFITLIIIFIS